MSNFIEVREMSGRNNKKTILINVDEILQVRDNFVYLSDGKHLLVVETYEEIKRLLRDSGAHISSGDLCKANSLG